MKNFIKLVPEYLGKSLFDIVSPLFQAWREIQEAELNEEMREILTKYHEKYLKFSLKVFCDLILFIMSTNLILVTLFIGRNNPHNGIAQLAILSIILISWGIKWRTITYEIAHKHIFPVFILFFGFILIFENTLFKEFKIYEIWPIFDFFWTLICITMVKNIE